MLVIKEEGVKAVVIHRDQTVNVGALNPSLPEDHGDTFVYLSIIMVLGVIAKKLSSKEPLDWKRFIGEMIFSFIGAIAVYLAGDIQGFDSKMILLMGALMSLGTVRAFEWFVKILGVLNKMVKP